MNRNTQASPSPPPANDVELDRLVSSRTSSSLLPLPLPSISKTIKSVSILQRKSPLASRVSLDSDADGPGPRREWVAGVVLCALGTAVITLLNLVLGIAAIAFSYSKYTNSSVDSLLLYDGDCSLSKGWSIGLHLLINIMSTLLLGASNYCMQCISAPSRSDVDHAHSQRKWLDIGTSGLRNLWYSDKWRKTLWVLLLISSLPIHLVYNSVVSSVITTYEYPVLIAQSDLLSQESPTLGDLETAQCFEENVGQDVYSFWWNLTESNRFERLSNEECVDKYAIDYVTDRKTVVLLTGNITSRQPAVLWAMAANGVDSVTNWADKVGGMRYRWLCGHNTDYGVYGCTKDSAVQGLETWHVTAKTWFRDIEITVFADFGTGTLENMDDTRDFYSLPEDLQRDLETLQSFRDNPHGTPDLQPFLDDTTNWQNASWAAGVTYTTAYPCLEKEIGELHPEVHPEGCLSERADEHCKLMFNFPIWAVVLACNVTKVICMIFTAKQNRSDIFLTLGDAMASFLISPDPATANRCLMSKSTVLAWQLQGLYPHRVDHGTVPLPATLPRRKWWLQAAGMARWAMAMFTAIVSLSVSGLLLHLGISAFDRATKNGVGIGVLWRLGFGTPNASALIPFRDHTESPMGTLGMILVANMPQLWLSILYFAINNLLTAMLLSREFSRYGIRRRALRVSWPRGVQGSTHYLTLPYRYSIPLLSSFAVLHWLLSQSIFYVQIDVDMLHDRTGTISTCGYSPIAIIFTIALGSLITLTLGLLGLRKYPSPVPLAVNCSAAISAACHPPSDDRDAALKPVMWGEVELEEWEGPTTPENRVEEGNEGVDSQRRPLMGNNENDSGSAFSRRQSSSVRSGSSDSENGSSAQERMRPSYGHCCFTSKEVVTPSATKLYM